MKKIVYYKFMKWDDLCAEYDDTGICFSDKEVAAAYAESGDTSTSSLSYMEECVIYTFDSVEECLTSAQSETKAQALAKLTDVEKRALGLI